MLFSWVDGSKNLQILVDKKEYVRWFLVILKDETIFFLVWFSCVSYDVEAKVKYGFLIL